MTGVTRTRKFDLSNCDREPIHVPGNIQSHGMLLACEGASWRVSHYSANAPDVLGVPETRIAGATLKSLIGETLVGEITKGLAADPPEGGTSVPARLFNVRVKGVAGKLDITAHEHAGRRVVEFESAVAKPGIAPLDLVRSILTRLQQTRSLNELCVKTVEQLRTLIGYDRVMIYRFLHDGTGQVIAEAKRDGMETLLNLRYPASDIPRQARELYKRNWVRLIADVRSAPVPLVSRLGPDGGLLDLTFAELRSVSPIHIEYLTNMGVGASMSISIVVGGELWGLIACHNAGPRHVPSNVRAACELLGQVFSLQIQTVEGIDAYVTMRAARALLDRVVSEFPIEGSLIDNLAARLEQLSSFIAADGVGVYVDGVWRGLGITPDASEIHLLTRHISTQQSEAKIFADHHLASGFAPAHGWRCGVRGVLAVPLSYEAGNWLLFFRREVAHTIEWGGDPSKPVVANAAGRISPRKSFEAWKEEVRGQSLPFTSRERLIADTLRVYLRDIIVRFSEVIMEERRQALQRQRLLASELNHRVKGTLELIQSLIHHGYEEQGKVQHFVRILEGRIRAIALAHDAISVASGSEVRTLVDAAVMLEAIPSERVSIEGPEVKLEAKAYTVLALVIHELATTASRSGFLNMPEGRLSVRWFLDASGQLVLLWQEAGNPNGRRVAPDDISNIIVRRNIPHALGGQAEISQRENGLKATFVVPARFVMNAPPALLDVAHRPQITAGPRLLEGYSVLLVEDQMPLAVELERALRERGASEVRVAGSSEGALALLSTELPDVAILDIDLGDETSERVAAELLRLEIPFVLAASEIDRLHIEARLREMPVVDKPYHADAVANALKDALLPHLIRAVLTKLV